MKKKKYAIVDIETTGGLARRDRITEIGIVLHDGEQILDTFESLVNPERSIPPNITQITGITDDMVSGAPRFFEIAKTIVEMTEGAIFVAHNVRFDYSFLKEEFRNLGYTFSKRQLDTVRLARTSFPGLRSYSLGNLINHFGIKVKNRHRALDDALATAELLERIFQKEDAEDNIRLFINHGLRESQLPNAITMDTIHNLPEECGVYYFTNEYERIVYIGKSINIQKRVVQHFNTTSRKAANLQKQVHNISYITTGSELISLLLESDEIKLHQPEINKLQRNAEYPYFIHHFYDEEGYLSFKIEKSSSKRRKDKNILSDYPKLASARNHLKSVTAAFELCGRVNGLETNDGPCFEYKIHRCFGACILKEDPLSYNERALLALEELNKLFDQNFIIVDQGRTNEEKAVVLIEDGYYKGYGYLLNEDLDLGIEEIKEAIDYRKSNPEWNNIVRNYLLEHPELRTIRF